MHATSEQFIAATRQQQVRLSDRIMNGLLAESTAAVGNEEHHSPVWTVGKHYVRDMEAGRWDGQPLSDQLLNPRLLADTPARFLAQVINASLTGPQEAAYPRAANVYGTCYKAENDWRRLVKRAYDDDSVRTEVYTDDTGPAILRKAINNPTGVLARNMVLGRFGIEYPAGSIVRIDDEFDDERIVEGRLELPTKEAFNETLDAVTGLSFARLSPIASPYGEREAHYGTHAYVQTAPDVEDIEMLARYAVETARY
ncbi:MAG TPA: hypothetical protein VD735_05930 [Candidatus Saccharimonadales bacterium]|nr:hypothetical protein [Candidatus Saccharimonadales bacterium]